MKSDKGLLCPAKRPDPKFEIDPEFSSVSLPAGYLPMDITALARLQTRNP